MSHLLQVLLLLAILVPGAKLGGVVSKRLGQPSVLGEMLTGLLLGPTLIDLLHLQVGGAPLFAPDLRGLIKTMAELGVILLMLLAGLETNLGEMRRVGAAAMMGAAGGVVLPLLAGIAISLPLYGLYESLYIGVILTATSVSISAQTLIELGALGSREGTTILGAAVIDDVLGIVLLSVVVAMAGGQAAAGAPIWQILLTMVLFFAGSWLLGSRLVPPLLQRARGWPGTEVPFAVALGLALLFAWGAEFVGHVAPITGSYLLGVIIARDPELKALVEERLLALAYGLFAPLFFVSIGLESDAVAALRSNPVFAAWIVVAAVASKLVGSALGVRLVGFGTLESVRVGTGMVSRGEVALIIAGIGLDRGVISADVFGVMVVMTLVTTLMTPMLLRWAFAHQGVPARSRV